MLLAADDDAKPAVADLGVETLAAIFHAARAFLDFVASRSARRRFELDGAHTHVASNFDDVTRDRENCMYYEKPSTSI